MYRFWVMMLGFYSTVAAVMILRVMVLFFTERKSYQDSNGVMQWDEWGFNFGIALMLVNFWPLALLAPRSRQALCDLLFPEEEV